MTREEHTSLIQKLRLNLSDEATATEILTSLSDDYGTVLTQSNEAQANAAKLKEDNEKLRDANMRLFLKVGNPAPPDDKGNKGGNEEKKTFESLFDDSGKLK